MQERDALIRVAAECAERPGRGRVVYARSGSRLSCTRAEAGAWRGRRGRARGLPARQRIGGVRWTPDPGVRAAHRDAHRRASQEIAEVAVRFRIPGGRVRHRGRGEGLPPRAISMRSIRAPGELPHDAPRRRGFACRRSGGRAVLARGAARPRRADRDDITVSPGPQGRQHGRGPARAAGPLRQDGRIPLEMCPPPTCRPARPPPREHPLRLLRQLRFRVTVNTDNG